jgi:hypothetical protein
MQRHDELEKGKQKPFALLYLIWKQMMNKISNDSFDVGWTEIAPPLCTVS